MNLSLLNVAFEVMKELNGLKYIYTENILGAISSVSHKHNYNLSDSEITKVKALVNDALERL